MGFGRVQARQESNNGEVVDASVICLFLLPIVGLSFLSRRYISSFCSPSFLLLYTRRIAAVSFVIRWQQMWLLAVLM